MKTGKGRRAVLTEAEAAYDGTDCPFWNRFSMGIQHQLDPTMGVELIFLFVGNCVFFQFDWWLKWIKHQELSLNGHVVQSFLDVFWLVKLQKLGVQQRMRRALSALSESLQ